MLPPMQPMISLSDDTRRDPRAIHESLPNVNSAENLVTILKSASNQLRGTFDALERSTQASASAAATATAMIAAEQSLVYRLDVLRVLMKDQGAKQQQAALDVEALVQNLLEVTLLEHLKKPVDAACEAIIDDLVKKEVALQLEQHLPMRLQVQVAEQKRLLREAQCRLHNSESRIANAMLTRSDLQKTLHTIYTMDGRVSPRFPATLNELFQLDAIKSKQLLRDYGIKDISESHWDNVNKFIQFCNVAFQM